MRIFKKLIRDNMPEIMAANGRKLKTRIITDDAEFCATLENKLLEEVQELRADPTKSKFEKIAYIYEILDALQKAMNISDEALAAERALKLKERGGFEKRIFLEGEEKSFNE